MKFTKAIKIRDLFWVCLLIASSAYNFFHLDETMETKWLWLSLSVLIVVFWIWTLSRRKN